MTIEFDDVCQITWNRDHATQQVKSFCLIMAQSYIFIKLDK
jgi:hypothetical protein